LGEGLSKVIICEETITNAFECKSCGIIPRRGIKARRAAAPWSCWKHAFGMTPPRRLKGAPTIYGTPFA